MPRSKKPLEEQPRCRVIGCGKVLARRGYCHDHAYRAYISKNFDLPTDPTEMVKAELLRGQKPRRPARPGHVMKCIVDECTTIGASTKKKSAETGLPRLYSDMCEPHYKAARKWGDPTLRRPRTSWGADNWNWRGNDVSYSGAHRRVTRARGPASSYPCALQCGKMAKHWAYNGNDPNQLYGPTASGSPYFVFYSPDPQYYDPLCATCHRRTDGGKAASELNEYREWRHRTGLSLNDVAIVKAILPMGSQ